MSKAENTRLTILQKAFNLIYKNGYQATSIDHIIATTSVTKGAFYYHFKNKEEMGLAIINDVMYPGMHQAAIAPLLQSDDAIAGIYKMMKGMLMDTTFFDAKYGCPAINLIEEMSPLNSAFSEALQRITNRWGEAIQASIEKSKQQGKVRSAVHSEQVAVFVLSGYGGIRNLGKMQGAPCYQVYLKELKNYLQSLA